MRLNDAGEHAPVAAKTRRVSCPAGHDSGPFMTGGPFATDDGHRFLGDTNAMLPPVSGDVVHSHEGGDMSPPAPRHRFNPPRAGITSTPSSSPHDDVLFADAKVSKPPMQPFQFLARSGETAPSAQTVLGDSSLARRMSIAGAMPPRPQGTGNLKRNVSDTGLPPASSLCDDDLDGLTALLGQGTGTAPGSARARALTVKRNVSSSKLWQKDSQSGRMPEAMVHHASSNSADSPLPAVKPGTVSGPPGDLCSPGLEQLVPSCHYMHAAHLDRGPESVCLTEAGLRDMDEVLSSSTMAYSHAMHASSTSFAATSSRSGLASIGKMSMSNDEEIWGSIMADSVAPSGVPCDSLCCQVLAPCMHFDHPPFGADQC
jgi:hypothetical protein